MSCPYWVELNRSKHTVNLSRYVASHKRVWYPCLLRIYIGCLPWVLRLAIIKIHRPQLIEHSQVPLFLSTSRSTEATFYYFAYGSCMCPVDLKRSLGEKTHNMSLAPLHSRVIGCVLHRKSVLRNCGVLDGTRCNLLHWRCLVSLTHAVKWALDERETKSSWWLSTRMIESALRDVCIRMFVPMLW
jgi:hypothetical protein